MTKEKEMRATIDLEYMPDHVDTFEDAACYLLMEMHKQNHALSRIIASLCEPARITMTRLWNGLGKQSIKQQYFYDMMKGWRPVDQEKPDKPAGDVVDIKTKH